ncbi:MAG: topology modulation protein [Chlorobi bacterium]|nr:topology modulation protein [Chlorobiota bacterium]
MNRMTPNLDRVVVIGSSGAGKSTLAASLAGALGSHHMELDALHWKPNWVPSPIEEFRERVGLAAAGDRWVADGNYGGVRDVLWARATAIIWLNYSFPVTFSRVVRRTFHRAITRQELYSGNRESLLTAFFSRESILLWVITTFRRRRREFPLLMRDERYRHIEFIVFDSPRATARFLDDVTHRAAALS